MQNVSHYHQSKNVIFRVSIIHYLHTYQKNCDEHHGLYVLNNKFAAIFIYISGLTNENAINAINRGIFKRHVVMCTYNDNTDL